MCQKTMSKKDAEQDVLILAERLAMLYYHFVKNIVEELGEKKAQEMIKKVIMGYGTDCGVRARDKVEKLGKPITLENYIYGKDLPSLGWEKNKLEIDEQNAIAREVTYCPFAETWRNLGFEKWGRLYCYVDQAKYQGYSKTLKCYHDENVLDGDKRCVVRVVKE